MRLHLIFTLFTVFFFTTGIRSQNLAPPLVWQHCYGGSLDDIGYSIAPYSDGGFIFCGCSGSSDGDIYPKSEPLHGGTCDYWAARIDADSNILYKIHLGGTGSDVARTTFETKDGNVIIAGSSSSTDVDVVCSLTDLNFWILMVNANYEMQWKKCYGGSGYDDFGSMLETADGGFAICGGTSSSNSGDVTFNHGYSDFWLVKTDASGNIEWQKCYGGTQYEKAFDIDVCADGGFIMAGFTASNDGDVAGNHSTDFDGWVMKTDALGNFQWQKCIGGTGQDGFYKVLQLANKNNLISGYTFSADGDITGKHGDEFHDDGLLVMLDENGNLLWSKAYGGDSIDELAGIIQDPLGQIFVSGYSQSSNGDLSQNYGNYDYWLMNIDENGTIIWDSTYGGPAADVCNEIAISTTGRLAMMGYTASDSLQVSGNHGVDTSQHPINLAKKKDFWIANFGSVVGIPEIIKSTLTIIPSLAHDAVQVSFNDIMDEKVLTTVRNTSGELVHNEMIIYQKQLLMDISSLPQGIYFIEVKSEEQIAIGKFVKM